MSSLLSDYLYELPHELIASHPLPQREESRMLVLHRATGQIEHRSFKNFGEYIAPEDLVVFNDSKVIPARLYNRERTIEVLLLHKRDPYHWVAMVKPGRKMRRGAIVFLGGGEATVKEIFSDGTRLLAFREPPDLERWGEMPIPPYYKRASNEEDRLRYQTVFAREAGSVAAPTAGLHFTQEIINQLPHTFVTLHVGPGTFLPVKTEDVSEHRMHSEHYNIEPAAAEHLNDHSKKERGSLIAVGTTTARVLESLPAGNIIPGKNSTAFFIRPPYQFQRVNRLLSNFHLPGSTLLMLVSALAGREQILKTYQIAVQEKYRFFSYGDCMLIL